MQADGFSPRRPLPPRPPRPRAPPARRSIDRRGPGGGGEAATLAARARDGPLRRAAIPAVPYAPAAAFLGSREGEARRRREGPTRVALIADGIGAMHGVTHTIERIRELGVPGFEVEVVGTDRRRRPPAAGGRRARRPLLRRASSSACPSLPDLVETLAEGRYDARPRHRARARPASPPTLHRPDHRSCRCSPATTPSWAPTPGCAAATPASRRWRGRGARRLLPRTAGWSSRRARRPTSRCASLGVDRARIGRWERGVDTSRFDPGKARPATPIPGEVKVLYAGRLTREKGVDLLAETFLRAHAARPAPAPAARRRRPGGGDAARAARRAAPPSSAGSRARTWPAPTRAPTSSSSASRTDTYGQVVVEAGASGLPVVAVAEGGPASLVEDGDTGLLCRARPRPCWPAALLQLAVLAACAAPSSARRRCAAARARTWERGDGAARRRLRPGHRAGGGAPHQAGQSGLGTTR